MAVVNLDLHCFKERSQKEITHTLFRQFFVYAVKDPLISEVETQLMSVGGVY